MKRWTSLLGALLCLMGCLCPCTAIREQERPGILVIDPGHGGEDGGAQSDWGLLESEVNLAVALRLEALCRFCAQPCRMTRSRPEIDYPPELQKTAQRKLYDQKKRVELINSTPDGVLLSIHQNRFPDPRPRGPQALYGAGEESRGFGELCHQLLSQGLCPENRRVAAPISRDIYLMREAKCPAVLVECGFLSNPEEARSLELPETQTKIACILLCAYLQYFHTMRGT